MKIIKETSRAIQSGEGRQKGKVSFRITEIDFL